MKRVATAIVGIPVALLVTLYAPDLLFALVISALAAICFDELLTLGAARLKAKPGKWVLALGAAITMSFVAGPVWVLMTLAVAFLVAMVALTFDTPLDAMLPRIAIVALGFIYCCVLFGFMVWLDRQLLVVLFGIIWAGDSAAYYGGRTMGRHLLAATISPKKTVEGAFAGLIASMIAGVLLGVWLVGESPSALLVGSLLAAVFGQVGDLAESALKRSAGVKDSSSILPGHGGMLDRFDSLLFALPVFYWFFNS